MMEAELGEELCCPSQPHQGQARQLARLCC